MEWKPIDTAPVGEDVLVFFAEAAVTMIAHRFDADGDWYQQDANACPMPIDVAATMWMPVPAVPA